MAFITFWVLLLLLPVGYVVYRRYFHSLAKFPGPFWASVTNFWMAYQLWSLRMPVTMTRMHEKYGTIVRTGPNELDFTDGDAGAQILKSGKAMPKERVLQWIYHFQTQSLWNS